MANRSSVIDREDILFNTNNGLDIYQKELNLTKKGGNYVALCPFHSEKTPSLVVYPNGGFFCYGCESKGDVFGFLMKKYGLTYKDALKSVNSQIKNLIISPKTTVKKKESKHITIEFTDMPFSKKHHEYFNEYELTEDFLTKERDIYAIKIYKVGEKTIKIPEDRIVFGLYAPDLKEIKFLTIGKSVPKDEKWRSFNIPNKYLWYYYKYNECCKDLFVCKSNKDSNVLAALGYCSIAVQSEGSKVLLQNNVDIINSMGNNVYMVYGSDIQGSQSSKEVTDITGWKWLNTQKYLLSWGINDPAEYAKQFGLQALDKEIKKQLKKKNGKEA